MDLACRQFRSRCKENHYRLFRIKQFSIRNTWINQQSSLIFVRSQRSRERWDLVCVKGTQDTRQTAWLTPTCAQLVNFNVTLGYNSDKTRNCPGTTFADKARPKCTYVNLPKKGQTMIQQSGIQLTSRTTTDST